jgi:hypothetical protein
MKKNYMIAALLLTASFTEAQFIEYTNYRGAFGAANTANWTDNWTEFDPQYKVYPNTTTTVQADITANTTWGSNDVVLLKNKVYVTNNATLTIQPGCIIRGDKQTEGTLIISRGSKLMAQGTETNPIVFTSNFDTASRYVGDWGGVILCGKAPMNQVSAVVEGGLDTSKARYGGVDPEDNSGILKYIRIEFAGFPFQPDKEINGLTFGAVGRGTTVDYIQCSYINDDSFEWFGGTVNCRHLISYSTVDDDFDTDFGYSGKVQYGLIIRDPDLSDQAASSTSEGFESDNDGASSTRTPMTTAVFTNITMVGPYRGNTTAALPANADFARCIRIRRNSGISIFNSIFTNFPTGIEIKDAATSDNVSGDTIRFKNNTFASIKNNDTCAATGVTVNVNQWFENNNNDYYTSSSSINWVNPYPELWVKPDYRLNMGSPMMAANATNFTDPKLGQVTFDVSVKEIGNVSNLTLYPNPASSTIVLEFTNSSNLNSVINITDVTGKLVRSQNLVTSTGKNITNIDIQSLDSGIYFVQLTINGKQTIKKFVKN